MKNLQWLGWITALWVSLPTWAGTPPLTVTQGTMAELYSLWPKVIRVSDRPPTPVDPVQTEMMAAYYALRAQLRQNSASLAPWLLDQNVGYLSDGLSREEKLQLTSIFETLAEHLRDGQTNISEILPTLWPDQVITKVRQIGDTVDHLKAIRAGAARFAINEHERNQQRYGDQPYSAHLQDVREVLHRFGFAPEDSLLGLDLDTAAWLHDILEDTDVTYAELRDRYGRRIAQIVRGVTKSPKINGQTERDRTITTYSRLRERNSARILKVADRIANVEQGLRDLVSGHPSKVRKYFDDWGLFKSYLYVRGDADEMWIHLERLLLDQAYAQKFTERSLRTRCATALESSRSTSVTVF